MKNIIQINEANECNVELVYSQNDGTDRLILDIRSDVSKRPRLEIGGGDVTTLDEHTEYEITKSLFIGAGTLIFKIIDSIGTYLFNITKSPMSNGTITIKQIDNFNYTLKVYKPPRSLDQLDDSITVLEDLVTNANSEIDFIKSKYYAFTNAIEIGENEDLNSYKTPGNYVCAWNDIANTVLHSPAGENAFTLKVDYANGTLYYIMQTVRLYRTGSTFCRHYTVHNSTWSSWYMQNQTQYGYVKGNTQILRAGNIVTYNTFAWQNGIFTINQGYRPMESLYAPALIRVEKPFGAALGSLYIKKDGTIQLTDNTFTTTTAQFLASVTWVTNDSIPF